MNFNNNILIFIFISLFVNLLGIGIVRYIISRKQNKKALDSKEMKEIDNNYYLSSLTPKQNNMLILACKQWNFSKSENTKNPFFTIYNIKYCIAKICCTEIKYIQYSNIFHWLLPIFLNTRLHSHNHQETARFTQLFEFLSKDYHTKDTTALAAFIDYIIVTISIAETKDIFYFDEKISSDLIKEYGLRK